MTPPPDIDPSGRCRWAAAWLLGLALARLSAADWSIELLYGQDEVFPSVLASVTDAAPFPPAAITPPQLGDPHGLIAVRLVAPRDHCTVRVALAGTVLYDPSEVTVELPRGGATYRVAPYLRLNHDRLAALRHPLAGELLRATVTVDGRTTKGQRSVRVHAINDCLTSVEIDGRLYEAAYLSAAYANEYNPELGARIIRHALRNHYVESFDGYESGNPEAVRAQVAAIYRSLQDLGFKYSSIYQASVHTSHTGTQWIRMPSEAMRANQANCADGSALFAAVLTQLQLRAVMFFVPYEHVFAGVYLTPHGGEAQGFDVIETTEVGYTDYRHACKEGAGKLARLRSRPHMREYRLTDQHAAEPFVWQPDKKHQRPDVFFNTDISAARKLGILPLPEPAPAAEVAGTDSP